MSIWDDVGSRAASMLGKALEHDELSHALLFLGPEGAGKRVAAVAIAAALTCRAKPLQGCGECQTCARVARGTHPDVHHIAPEGAFIRVETVREGVIQQAARSPFEAAVKVFIIEDADRMNISAQNALLKTLEEPPSDTTFILLSTREDELLETVRSRARTIRFEAVPERRITALLVDEGVEDGLALAAARMSGGSYLRARALALDPDLSERRRRWAALGLRLTGSADALERAVEVIDDIKLAVKGREAAQKDEMTRLVEAAGEGRGTAAMRTALAARFKRELRRAEEELYLEALDAFASFYRDALALRRGAAETVVNLLMMSELEDWAARRVDDRWIVEVMARCSQAQAALSANANPLLTLESVFLTAVPAA
ncbi:MAG TPA: DNA polymerase III subunit delta' [Actinomycetota bacterium]|nr:DNA polymerase III subunit delta' [Actinomycetota bacterium]